MKLTCPDCATQFSIDADVIGPNGRTVRCSQCSATWFVASDPDVIDLREQVAGQQSKDNFTDGYVARPENIVSPPDIRQKAVLDSSVVGAAALAKVELERKALELNHMDEFDVSDTPHAQIRDKREQAKVRRRLAGVAMIWVVTLLILIIGALLSYVFRAQITEKFPVTIKIYQAFGLSIPLAGLEIYGIETHYGDDSGVQTLFVNGKIKNVDRVARDVPLLRLSLKNAAGDVLESWIVEPNQAVLKSEGILKFSSQFPNPPTSAEDLATNFVDELISTSGVPVKID